MHPLGSPVSLDSASSRLPAANHRWKISGRSCETTHTDWPFVNSVLQINRVPIEFRPGHPGSVAAVASGLVNSTVKCVA